MNFTIAASNLEVLDILNEIKESGNVISICFRKDKTVYKSFVTAVSPRHAVLLIDRFQPIVPAKRLKRGAQVNISTNFNGKQIEFSTRIREPLVANQQLGYQLDVPSNIRETEDLKMVQKVME